jgi:hypothetical protein
MIPQYQSFNTIKMNKIAQAIQKPDIPMNGFQTWTYHIKTCHTHEWFSKPYIYSIIMLSIKGSETGIQCCYAP